MTGRLVTVTTNYMKDPPEISTKDVSLDEPSITYYLQGYQITDTESHPEWLRRRKGHFHKDLGGPFFSQKWHTETNVEGGASGGLVDGVEPPAWPKGRFRIVAGYSGPILPLPPQNMIWPTVLPSSDSTLNEAGATAISRCSPSNPSVDLAETIGEIVKDGIPRLIGSTLKSWRGLSSRDRRRAIGQEYLNYEFGWKPFVSDLMSFCSGVVDADDVFKRYERGSGTMVRRSYDFPELLSTDIVPVAFDVSPYYVLGNSALLDAGTINKGTVYRSDSISVRRWFRGAFSYYVPPVSSDLTDSIARAVIYARKTFGISLTPDTLWNLAPWSWAVDWFSDTGDVISNWTDWAIDNQVLLYGYIMEHKVHTRTYTFTGPHGFMAASMPNDVTFVVETKTRRQASPYGFGLKWEDFSSRQKAIIAALGVSRSR